MEQTATCCWMTASSCRWWEKAAAVRHLISSRRSPKAGQRHQEAVEQCHLQIVRNRLLYCSCPSFLFTPAQFRFCILLNASLSLCLHLINIISTNLSSCFSYDVISKNPLKLIMSRFPTHMAGSFLRHWPISGPVRSVIIFKLT